MLLLAPGLGLALDGAIGLVIGSSLALLGQIAGARTLLWVALAAWVLVPMVVLAAGLPTPAGVSPTFVIDNPAAHHLAFLGFLSLVLGVMVDERRR